MNDFINVSLNDESFPILFRVSLSEIKKMILDQINSTNDSITMVDHFTPMYQGYKKIIDNSNSISGDTDEAVEASEHMQDICLTFITVISEQFDINTIDYESSDAPLNIVIGLAKSLYDFFVLDMEKLLKEIIMNYITRNFNDLVNAYAPTKTKKDSSTISNKKLVGSEYGIIISNIYDISSWVLDNLTFNDMLEYASEDILPVKFLKTAIAGGTVDCSDTGEAVAELFKSNDGLKSRVCFDCISMLKIQFDNEK